MKIVFVELKIGNGDTWGKATICVFVIGADSRAFKMIWCPRALSVMSGIQSFVPSERRGFDEDDEDEGLAHRSSRRALYNALNTNSGVNSGVIDG
jgi:hypothetical protein